LDAEASITMANMIRHGSAVSLLPIGIASITAFAFKTAVVVDYAQRHQPFFSPTERKRFAEGLYIPNGIQIWLSTFRSRQFFGQYFGHYAKLETGHSRGFKVYVFTYVVGFLVVQLVAFRWGSRILKTPRFTPHLSEPVFWRPISVPLYPWAGKRITWPTEQYLTEQTLRQFAERCGNVSERI
jgi:hypothetical protein